MARGGWRGEWRARGRRMFTEDTHKTAIAEKNGKIASIADAGVSDAGKNGTIFSDVTGASLRAAVSVGLPFVSVTGTERFNTLIVRISNVTEHIGNT